MTRTVFISATLVAIGALVLGGCSAFENLGGAKATQGGIDPNIRSRVNRDTRVIADNDKSFIDSLIFWQDKQPLGTVVDPAKEQQRLRDAQAAGQPSTGPTPTITRRKRGLLE